MSPSVRRGLGVNAAGNVFRRSASGVGGWDAVDGNLKKLPWAKTMPGSLGFNPIQPKTDGIFERATAGHSGIPSGVAGIAGNMQAKLTWSPVLGAAGYNVKRGSAMVAPTPTQSFPHQPTALTLVSRTARLATTSSPLSTESEKALTQRKSA